MKNVDLDAECDFRRLSPEEIETACKYEYMRESQALRDAVGGQKKKPPAQVPLSFGQDLNFPELFLLVLALNKAGFPKPWKQLRKNSRMELILRISKWETERKKSLPPLVIETASIELDERKLEQATADQPYHWRLEPSEPNLLRKYEQSGREYFFGFIRIDQAYNETEVVAAFKEEFRRRWEKTKGGNRERWRAKLNDLVVMRLLKRFPPGKGYLEPYKRLKLVAKFCGYKGCVEEAAAYKKRCKDGRGDEPMSNAAKVEMSSARSEARIFFQSLFPGEDPLSY